jgi:hypothetical protein
VFDIKYLLIAPLAKQLENLSDFKEKAEFLLKLINFEIYFKKYADDISESWYRETEERYCSENYSFIFSDKAFIIQYADKTQNIGKVIELINKLCSPDVFDYDNVIAETKNETAIIANIDDFEFSEETVPIEQNKIGKKTKLNILLKFSPGIRKK